MIAPEFTHEYAYPDADEVRVRIGIHPLTAPAFAIEAIVDTGASVTLLDRELAPLLGITDVTKGRERALRLADESMANAFEFDVVIEVLGLVLQIPALMSPAFPPGIDNLLGVRGLLDQLDIAILHGERRLLVRKSGLLP